jgi:hypothetical protein
MVELETDETEEQAAERVCNCEGAKRARKIAQSVEQANDNIDLEFYKTSQAAAEILKAAAKPIGLGKIASVTVDIGNGVKGIVKATNKGTIRVTKTVTKKVEHDE